MVGIGAIAAAGAALAAHKFCGASSSEEEGSTSTKRTGWLGRKKKKRKSFWENYFVAIISVGVVVLGLIFLLVYLFCCYDSDPHMMPPPFDIENPRPRGGMAPPVLAHAARLSPVFAPPGPNNNMPRMTPPNFRQFSRIGDA